MAEDFLVFFRPLDVFTHPYLQAILEVAMLITRTLNMVVMAQLLSFSLEHATSWLTICGQSQPFRSVVESFRTVLVTILTDVCFEFPFSGSDAKLCSTITCYFQAPYSCQRLSHRIGQRPRVMCAGAENHLLKKV